LDDNLAALLSLGCKDDVVAFFPALNDQGLTWEHMRCEASVDLGQALRVVGAEPLLNDSGTVAIAAQAVENRLVKSSHFGHFWVNVQRVSIVAQSVEEGLVLLSCFLFGKVGSPFGHLREALLDFTLVAKASDAAHEQT